MSKKDDMLHAYWSAREQDLVLHHPAGPQTGADGHMLYGALCYDKLIGGLPFVKELEKRGYDIKTLKFSIAKKAGHPRWAPPVTAPTQPSSGEKP